MSEDGFFIFASVIASVAERHKLIIDLKQMPQPPYKLARLIESETSRWYVVFYVWDADREILIRKRDYDVNKLPTKSARREFAKKQIREIDKLLINGYHVHKKKHTNEQAAIINFREEYTIAEAFKVMLMAIKNSKRKATYNSYSSIANMFVAYCKLQRWDQWPVKSLQKTDIIAYLDFSQAKGIGNTTRNKYCSAVKAMLGMMVERGMIAANPASKIKKEPEDVGKNIAFDTNQVPELKTAILNKNVRLWYFAQFMYYGFIRPAELARMRINMLDLKNSVIVLPANITKNHKIRYVRLSGGLIKVIEEMQLDSYPANSFVFGWGLLTGEKPLQKNFAWHNHSKILSGLNFGTGYTLYSWKHTGVVAHYKAGIDIKSLQQQTGHSSLDELSTYLKTLGLLADKAAFDKSPEI